MATTSILRILLRIILFSKYPRTFFYFPIGWHKRNLSFDSHFLGNFSLCVSCTVSKGEGVLTPLLSELQRGEGVEARQGGGEGGGR
jgi:hypothetical protein